ERIRLLRTEAYRDFELLLDDGAAVRLSRDYRARLEAALGVRLGGAFTHPPRPTPSPPPPPAPATRPPRCTRRDRRRRARRRTTSSATDTRGWGGRGCATAHGRAEGWDTGGARPRAATGSLRSPG